MMAALLKILRVNLARTESSLRDWLSRAIDLLVRKERYEDRGDLKRQVRR
jgi:hypothetical protein